MSGDDQGAKGEASAEGDAPAETPAPEKRSGTGRRAVLLGTLAAVTAGTAGTIAYFESRPPGGSPLGTPDRPGLLDPDAVVTQRRRLGRTNLQVSVIGIGAGGLRGTDPVIRAVDKGMNYIDTSICYGDSEKVIKKALLQSPGLRQRLIIATKWDPGPDAKKEEILASLDRSLDRLGVDHVDIMQVHWLGGGHVRPDTGFNRLDNPELYLAMEEAKRSGKVRFFGATSHDANRSKVLVHAIDKGAFDMILVKMNLLDHDKAGGPELLAKAKEKDVGVVVMKSQPEGGALPPGFEKSKYSVFQANLRWVLSHPEVACVVHSHFGVHSDWQDAGCTAVKETLSVADAELLEMYANALSPSYCRGCGECASACPSGIAIPHVLQFEMYERRYGWRDRARAHYRALPLAERWSDACLSCDRCSEACPHGVDAAGRVRAARALG
jgi:predicted aldo/keto reductase-like oxidoreductase